MQTILGANGQIAVELAKELKQNYIRHIRLVSRNPRKVNESDVLFPANLMDKKGTLEAIKGSEIAYLTVGLPMDTVLWKSHFPTIMENVIHACKAYNTKLVFFDNTYMYPQNDAPLTEVTPFQPIGLKGRVRDRIATMLLREMESGSFEAVICRAPEFYGPGKTQSITNSIIFGNINQARKLKVFLRDDTLRTLIWTPDASRAMALIGNSPGTFGQTWHLPCDDNRLTYKQFITLASEIYNKPFEYTIIPRYKIYLSGIFNKRMKEMQELLPRYAHNNIFVSDKFKARFPEFRVTTYRQGIEKIRLDRLASQP